MSEQYTNKGMKLMIPFDEYTVEYSLEKINIGHEHKDRMLNLSAKYDVIYKKNGKNK